MACAATLSASINVQRMAVKAAVEGDVTLLKQAMLHDPLTAAVCDPEEIWQMTDEFLIEQAQWLPNYKKALPAAKASLAAVKKNGTYKGTRSIKGVARLHTKTVAEMRKEAAKHRAQAAASDKAAAQRAKDVTKATKK